MNERTLIEWRGGGGSKRAAPSRGFLPVAQRWGENSAPQGDLASPELEVRHEPDPEAVFEWETGETPLQDVYQLWLKNVGATLGERARRSSARNMGRR